MKFTTRLIPLLLVVLMGCSTIPNKICLEEEENCTMTYNQKPPDIVCEVYRYCSIGNLRWKKNIGTNALLGKEQKFHKERKENGKKIYY